MSGASDQDSQHAGLVLDDNGTDLAVSIEESIRDLRSLQAQDDHGQFIALSSRLKTQLASQDEAKDIFRRLHGFEALLSSLKDVDDSQRTVDARAKTIEAFTQVLALTIRHHRGNARYFSRRVNGWQTLKTVVFNVLQLSLGSHPGQDGQDHATIDHVGSSLLSLALDDDKQTSFLVCPEAAAILLEAALSPDLTSLAEQFNDALARLASACEDSTVNQVSLWNLGVSSELLRNQLSHSSASTIQQSAKRVLNSLAYLGLPDLRDSTSLFKSARTSDTARTILEDALSASKQPAFLQFDLTLHGFSSVELPCLPRSFPPSGGYTFSAWLRFDTFDSNCHTTIFGLFDPSQTCFVLAYLEKDTHQLILQTSIKSARPSVRFKSTVFETGRWYHVGLTHKRSASDARQSAASLFVDGEFAEQVKCAYPESPPTTSRDLRSAPSSSAMPSSVQLFLGTPRDLAFNLGRNQTTSRWSIGSTHLFQVPLSDEFIAVQYRLGPRYSGNFQDCLGPLLTYRASAELNRYNELLHPDKSEKSDIVQATEHHGSEVVSEAKILFSFSPQSIVSTEDNHAHQVVSESSLSYKSLQKYRKLSSKATAFAINAAVSSINEAVSRQFGTATLTGDPVVAKPFALDDASWCVAGSLAAVYKIVESANDVESLLTAIRIFFECIKDNWRISESMEKGSGFGVLAVIIREKLGLDSGITASLPSHRKPCQPLLPEHRHTFANKCLRLVLEFVGYDSAAPEKSMIINPMAYRVLLIDLDTWRRCDNETAELYYTQFIHFSQRNLHHTFNQKRLGRMRVVRKLLDAMKTEDVDSACAKQLMLALRTLIDQASVHNPFKDLAMFVAFGLQDERTLTRAATLSVSSAARLRQRADSEASRKRGSGSSTPRSIPDTPRPNSLSRPQLALHTLQLLSDIVCESSNPTVIRRFVKTTPTRWMSHLLSESDVRIVTLDLRIITQALTALGQEFKHPFADKNGGFIAMKARLKLFWQIPEIWRLCFCMLLGRPPPRTQTDPDFTVFSLIDELEVDQRACTVVPEALAVLMAMLEAGLRSVVRDEKPAETDLKIVKTVIQFLSELPVRNQSFRDFANSSGYAKELLFVLYPVIVGSDRLSADTELRAEKDSLSFKGEEVVLRPHSNSLGERPPSVRSLQLDRDNRTPSPGHRRIAAAPRRLSSFVLVNGRSDKSNLPTTRFSPIISPNLKEPVKLNVGNSIVESLLEVAVNLFIDQICNKKDFNGIGLFQKVPPGFKEHQAYFESYVIVHTLSQLWAHLQLERQLLQETKVLTNLSRYCVHLAEAVFEGWFIEGAQPVIDFIGKILEYLQIPDIAALKSVRLCSQAINSMRVVFLRVTLLRLSELDESTSEKEPVEFLQQMCYWQTILFSSDNQETLFTKLICFLLYLKLTSPVLQIRLAAANLWRLVLMQKPTETATMLTVSMGAGQRHLSTGFMRLVQMDDDEFIKWVDENRMDLDDVLIESLAKPWADFVNDENRRNEETARSRLYKRKEKLRQWQQEESSAEEFLQRFELSTTHWRSNIYSQERMKLQRALQDSQEMLNGIWSVIAKLDRQSTQPAGLDEVSAGLQWRLDLTEGLNRMRMRTLRDRSAQKQSFQSKKKASEVRAARRLTINTPVPDIKPDILSSAPFPPMNGEDENAHGEDVDNKNDPISGSQLLEGAFEMIEDPKEDEDGIIEDKNRKVMTSLQRGDMVQQLYNVSRIVGLEACEGLLVVGKKCLYMQDNFFQRSDGEIVSVAQAPEDERDPYLQLISGKDLGSQPAKHTIGDHGTRHWTWTEVLSISKRRFLFRDVSLEIFFSDGRSYLLTCIAVKARDDLYSAIVNRAPHIHNTPASTGEDSWRLDNLRNPEEVPSSLGSKFANVFSGASSYAATKKWIRGEMSNFQYIMLVNTLAGRSFNDLTQYPVFPWVLADYHSDELDLTDPRTFRDFSKPMGCQTPAREAEFRDRYQQFADMSDQSAPAFNYGTHYSSAMIVSSYLIRLQPFVQTYLLLQGGNFDHADRLFDSIERAWLSASRDNMSDVRELTPEFFYLPEFLTNVNSYDFGTKQGDGGTVNDVKLPPWAKGDPHVFITKHREALESPYVSEQLHQWLDLIFGFKQRGEAAVAAANVFQHLSYGGAKDLDTIDDPVERLATIGIIHSFGQTPHQVFPKPHPARDMERCVSNRLDAQAESLIRLPSPLFESDERIASLAYSRPQERLLCSGPGKANILPTCDRYLQWKMSDNSLRFYSSNSKRLMGLYENSHIGPIVDVCFADSKTLITGGADCTIGVWNLNVHRDWIEMQARTYLFGHRSPISIITASRIFSTIASVSRDGQVLLWDLNRYDCIRELIPAGGGRIGAVTINNNTGHILLCCGPDVLLFSLNGHLLLRQRVCDHKSEAIACCAFYEGDHSEWLERQILFTGHDHGVANAWSLTSLTDGSWHLQLVNRLNHTDSHREDGSNISATITSILPMPTAVYTGDDRGKVWQWDILHKQGITNGRGR